MMMMLLLCRIAGPPRSAPPLMAMQVRRPQAASVTMVQRQPQPPPQPFQQPQQPPPRSHLSLVRWFLCFNGKSCSCRCE